MSNTSHEHRGIPSSDFVNSLPKTVENTQVYIHAIVTKDIPLHHFTNLSCKIQAGCEMLETNVTAPLSASTSARIHLSDLEGPDTPKTYR